MSNLNDLINQIALKYSNEARDQKAQRSKGKIKVRVNDFDTRTHAELETQQWSGLRANQLWMRFEIWILGRLAGSLPFSTFMERPDSLNEFYALTFGMHDAALEDETHKAVIEVEARKVAKLVMEDRLKGRKI